MNSTQRNETLSKHKKKTYIQKKWDLLYRLIFHKFLRIVLGHTVYNTYLYIDIIYVYVNIIHNRQKLSALLLDSKNIYTE